MKVLGDAYIVCRALPAIRVIPSLLCPYDVGLPFLIAVHIGFRLLAVEAKSDLLLS